MPIATLFIDLDGTLYPEKNGLWKAIKDRITRYLIECMRFTPAEAERVRRDYLSRYGTTLRGLQVEHNINPDEFLAFVHDLPLDSYLQSDPLVRKMLERIELPKWIFTNSDQNHVRRVLKILDLENIFDGIVDIYALDFNCKPDAAAYMNALRIARAGSPEKSILIDDSLVNIRAASKLGFRTIYVRDPDQVETADGENHELQAVDYVIPQIIDLQIIMAEMNVVSTAELGT